MMDYLNEKPIWIWILKNDLHCFCLIREIEKIIGEIVNLKYCTMRHHIKKYIPVILQQKSKFRI